MWWALQLLMLCIFNAPCYIKNLTNPKTKFRAHLIFKVEFDPMNRFIHGLRRPNNLGDWADRPNKLL